MTSHDEIRDAIEAWGLTLEMGTHGMGWPQITTLGRVVEEGPTGAAIRRSKHRPQSSCVA